MVAKIAGGGKTEGGKDREKYDNHSVPHSSLPVIPVFPVLPAYSQAMFQVIRLVNGPGRHNLRASPSTCRIDSLNGWDGPSGQQEKTWHR